MSDKFRVLVADSLSQRGIALLQEDPRFQVDVKVGLKQDALEPIIGNYHALLIRSQTQVTRALIEKAASLKMIGRAGVGVDNVDVEAATERGILVMNTPGGNTISTAEHAFSLMLSLARKIPQAHASMKAGEWNRKAFEGTEICNKVLGIIGMGRIGGEFARRAIAFGMRVICFDPYLSAARAKSLQVELVEQLDPLLEQADFITIHTPLTPETQGLINAKRLAQCKKGVRIINCARGGLIDEAALAEALQSGHVGGAALDVYEQEPPPADFPLRALSNVVLTPHLAASTAEAQESVGIEIAEAVRDALTQGAIRNAVNMPNLDARTAAALAPYLDLAARLGKLVSQLAPKRLDCLKINYSGRVRELDTAPITRAILKGVLVQAAGTGVNEVNAPLRAKNLGLEIVETKLSQQSDFADLITLEAVSAEGTVEIAATFYGNKPRIVGLRGFSIEFIPEGLLFLMENKDRPGIVGWIGTIFGKHKVNIGNMSLSRGKMGEGALCVLSLDSFPPAEAMKEIEADKDITNVRLVDVG
ncbi:MAG: phosphoglycerate dehydrogenase [Verrucomicrobium sp.]|nr:phosphoglycerate dehydrogenase [Verrucomicrobium sp.]